jgi:hypothetical protein
VYYFGIIYPFVTLADGKTNEHHDDDEEEGEQPPPHDEKPFVFLFTVHVVIIAGWLCLLYAQFLDNCISCQQLQVIVCIKTRKKMFILILVIHPNSIWRQTYGG